MHSSRDFHAPISVGLCGALNSPIAGAAGQDVSHAIKEKPESILAQISQETLAEMIGTTRLGTHSNPCDHYGCEGETREIVLRMAVISGCDASPVLELAEHAFDEISAFVGPAVQRIGRPA